MFTLTDQWRAQATGYAGDPNVQTPYLDSLAEKSIRFGTAVSTCPVCCPARACLLTGQYPLTHGIFVNQIRLEPNTTTLLDLVGAPVPDGVEGMSFAKHILGKAEAPSEASLFGCYVPFANYAYDNGGREYRGVRTSRYTYVRDLEGPWLLYNNEEDPYQLENLCNRSEMRAVQMHLEGVLSDLLEKQNDTFATGHELLDRWGYEMINPHAFRKIQIND